jgi:xanthine dehydrogenase accessory factor
VVVASHGRGEEQALTAALESSVPYVGLVASARRGRSVVDSLDLPETLRARVRTPAGLDIGARTPEEVALSILAEIVASRPRPARPAPTVAAADGAGLDPVCGMRVTVADAVHLEHEGRLVWFCGRGCLQAFRANPGLYPA